MREDFGYRGECKMNKIVKTILSVLITVLLMFCMPLYSKALTLDDIIDNGNSFLEVEDSGLASKPDEGKLQDLSNTVSGILLTISLVVTLISAVVMGINFVVQSVEDKAKIKESMIPWIIGIFISFGAYAIWKITMSIFYNL